MFIVCAWCKAQMGEKFPFDDKRTTHSMCSACESQTYRSPAFSPTESNGNIHSK